MSESLFNPETFLETETSEAGSTVVPTLAPGEYAQAVIISVKARKAGEYGFIDLTYEFGGSTLCPDGRTIQQAYNRDKMTARQSLILDLTPGGTLDMGEGKNVKLNRVRKAVNQNIPGQLWKPGMLNGQLVNRVKVIQRSDKNDPSVLYTEVSDVVS